MDFVKKALDFSKKSSDNKKIIVIYGPTASGKTSLSLDIAETLNTEIISTDSRQIFKYMDIGTGKIKKNEARGIIHHMIDIITPDQIYSVGAFKKDVKIILENIWQKGKVPILCGGTGLYIDSIIYDFDVPEVIEDKELREELEALAEKEGKNYVYEILKEIDPVSAEKIHPNNLRYVIRALEVFKNRDKSKEETKTGRNLKYETLFVKPDYFDRKNLYSRITKRVDQMFEEGLVEENKKLLDMGYSRNSFGLEAIGYSEVLDYLEGKMSLHDAIELVKKNSRNYAKRQETWFKRYEKFTY